jgi:hypothetical protein
MMMMMRKMMMRNVKVTMTIAKKMTRCILGSLYK